MGLYLNDDNLDEADVALQMLARTRELLDGGQRWRGDKMAAVRLGLGCDPLSSEAQYFSLVGAATRARWELREKLAQTSDGEIRAGQILQAMSANQETSYSGQLGWRHIDMLLDGLENALQEDRKELSP